MFSSVSQSRINNSFKNPNYGVGAVHLLHIIMCGERTSSDAPWLDAGVYLRSGTKGLVSVIQSKLMDSEDNTKNLRCLSVFSLIFYIKHRNKIFFLI